MNPGSTLFHFRNSGCWFHEPDLEDAKRNTLFQYSLIQVEMGKLKRSVYVE